MKRGKEETGPVGNLENLVDGTKEYFDMRIDAVKLQLVENLSILFSKILFYVIVIILTCIGVAFFASALSWWIGGMLGSQAAGNLITGGIVLLIALFLLLLRKKLFINSMVATFSRMFFEPSDKNYNSKADSIEKLRLERRILDNEIANHEMLMGIKYSQFKESLSIARLLASLVSKISLLFPIIEWGQKIYGAILNKFSKSQNIEAEEKFQEATEVDPDDSTDPELH